jgi:hypothetical protein
MKRIYCYRIAHGISLNIEVKLNPETFGIKLKANKKKKKAPPRSKTKKENSVVKIEGSRPDVLQEAISNAEKLLGRKMTMTDITGGKTDDKYNSKENGDSRRERKD